MKLWIDDVRPAPLGYNTTCRSVDEAKARIELYESYDDDYYRIELIDIDHDAGKFADFGGDYVKLLDWLEQTGRNYPIHIHAQNPVGVANMRKIIQRNGWKEV